MDKSKLIHDKWIAFGIWAALLVALIFTSHHAATISFGGALSNMMQYTLFSNGSLQQLDFGIESIIGMLAPIIAIFSLLNTWLRFKELTNELVVAFAISTREESPLHLFDPLLVFTGAEDNDTEDPNPNQADSSLVGDVIRSLAITWTLILVTAPLLIAIFEVFN